MTKVLLINGSPRKAGNTNLALCEIMKQLKKNGIDAEIVQVGTKAVRGRIGCRRDADHAHPGRQHGVPVKEDHAAGEPQYPQREEHVYTHFIR